MQQSRGHPLPRWDPRAPSPSPAGQHAARSPAVPAFPATAPGPRCAPPRAHSGLPAAGPSGWRSPAAVEGKIPHPSGESESAHTAQGSAHVPSPQALGTAASMDIPGPECPCPAPAALHAGNSTRPLFPPLRFPFGSGSGAQSRLGHGVKVTQGQWQSHKQLSSRHCHQILPPWAPTQTTRLWGHGEDTVPHTLKERSPFSSESWLIFRSIWPFSVLRSWHCLRASCKRTIRLQERRSLCCGLVGHKQGR